jgi:hypothetical protein
LEEKKEALSDLKVINQRINDQSENEKNNVNDINIFLGNFFIILKTNVSFFMKKISDLNNELESFKKLNEKNNQSITSLEQDKSKLFETNEKLGNFINYKKLILI